MRGRWGARTISLLTSDEVSPLISGADEWHLWQLRALLRVCNSAVMLISMTEDTLQHLLLNPLGVGIWLKELKDGVWNLLLHPVSTPAPDLGCLLVYCEINAEVLSCSNTLSMEIYKVSSASVVRLMGSEVPKLRFCISFACCKRTSGGQYKQRKSPLKLLFKEKVLTRDIWRQIYHAKSEVNIRGWERREIWRKSTGICQPFTRPSCTCICSLQASVFFLFSYWLYAQIKEERKEQVQRRNDHQPQEKIISVIQLCQI